MFKPKPFIGKEHIKATTSACDKPLHVCCRLPNYPDPIETVDDRQEGRNTCEDRASASSYYCGDTDLDDTEDAVFADNDCVFEPCKKPATQKCGTRNTFGVNSKLESIGAEYNVG